MNPTALTPGQFNTSTPLEKPASTNPIKNVNPNILKQGQSYMGGTVGFDTATGLPLAKGGTTLKNPVSTQSTTTLSSDKSKDILNAQNTTNQFAQGGVTTDPATGVATTADGKPYTPPITYVDQAFADSHDMNAPAYANYRVGNANATKEKTEGITSTGGYVGETYYAQGSTLPTDAQGNYIPTTPTSKTSDLILESLNNQKIQADALTAQMVSNIEQQYANLIKQQEQVNAGANAATQGALFRSGAAQGDAYAQNAMQYQIKQGVDALADLETKKQSAILAAKQAGQTQNFKLQEAINNQLADIATKQAEAGQKLSDKILEAQTKAKEKQITASRDNAVVGLYQQGITDPNEALNYLNYDENGNQIGDFTLKEVADTLALASGIGGTGIVGEYNFYKAEAIKAGQVPVDFTTYQNEDANRKKSIAAAGIATQYGLDKEQRTRVAGLLDDYDKQAKDIKTVISQSKQIDALSSLALSTNKDKGSRAAAQIGTIFSFMKMLDPTSTVREGEYATAQNTAGVGDKIRNAYNKVVDGSFLTDGQISGYVSTGKALAESRRRQLEEIDKEFNRRSAIFGIPAGVISDTASTTTNESIIQTEEQAKTKVIEVSKSNPQAAAAIAPLLSTYSYSDIIEALPELFN